MTANDWKRLKTDAEDTMAKIDISNLKPSSYAALGASIAILDHPVQSMEQSDYKIGAAGDDRADELRDAEKYYHDWQRTGIDGYKKLALDELSHFLFVSEQAGGASREMQAEHDRLLEMLGGYPAQEHEHMPSGRLGDHMRESRECFAEYAKEKALHRTTGAAIHAQYSMEHLKHMLKRYKDIALTLYRAGSEDEKEAIKEAYKDIVSEMRG